jgi:hypothetical protein
VVALPNLRNTASSNTYYPTKPRTMRFRLALLTLPFLGFGFPTMRPADTKDPSVVANTATVRNFCQYIVYLSKVSPGTVSAPESIPPNGTYSTPLTNIGGGGVSLKVSREASGGGPVMQFEYTVTDADVWYNLSLIDCTNTKNGCVGHERGFRAVSGPDCHTWECLGYEACTTQAYFEGEYGYKPNPPVGKCSLSEGLAFELCSMDRNGGE